jgi:hypothetical protein
MSQTARRLISYVRNTPYFSDAQTKLSMRFLASQLIAGKY